jgi:hypothetical protein
MCKPLALALALGLCSCVVPGSSPPATTPPPPSTTTTPAQPAVPVPRTEPSPPEVTSVASEVPITVCILAPGGPQTVNAIFRPAFADTLARTENGDLVPLRERFPSSTAFAHERSWYHQKYEHEPTGRLRLFGTEYWRYGKPVTVTPQELARPGPRLTEAVIFDGVRLYKVAGEPDPPTFLYAPLATDCVFQAYVNRRELRPRS